MTKKGLYTISAIIFFVLMGFITLPPITKMIDKVEPHIMGMPFFQFFLFIIPVALAIWLFIWFKWEVKIEDREAEEEEKAKKENAKGGLE